MNFSLHFQPLAQAYLIEGKKEAVEQELLSLLGTEHGIVLQGNPDFWSRQYATFAIEHAREVKESALQRKSGASKRVFVIYAEGFTREASNALLKTLEEPGEDTHFFLVIPSVRRVLPTIVSRVRMVKHPSVEKEGVLAKEFAAAAPGARMKMVKDVLAKLENEEWSRSDVRTFIEEVLGELRGSSVTSAAKKDGGIARHAQIASYAEDQSASLKMILEYLALS